MTTPHPDDVAALAALMADLKLRREKAELTQRDLAAHIGLSPDHLNELENHPSPQVRLGTIHRVAAGLGVEPVYRLDGLVDPPLETALSASMQAMWKQTGDPSYLSGRLMARIAAARRWLGLDARNVGTSMGLSQSYVYWVERPKGDVEYATAAGLCRALGGRLDVTLVDVEEVADAAA